jgi:hypothetical protein
MTASRKKDENTAPTKGLIPNVAKGVKINRQTSIFVDQAQIDGREMTAGGIFAVVTGESRCTVPGNDGDDILLESAGHDRLSKIGVL